jgi:anti-sigma-K factor RskA
MKSHKDLTDISGEPATESDALRLSDIADRDAARIEEFDAAQAPGTDDEELWPVARNGSRRIAIAAAAVVVVAAAVVGGKIAYDRRKSARGYHKAVAALEDARDALISAASELPERGREALQRVRSH